MADVEPPRWHLGGPEIACIVVSGIFWVILLSLVRSGDDSLRAKIFRPFCGGDGSFQWESLRQEHITHDTRGLGPGKFAALRLCFAICGFAVDAYGFYKGPDAVRSIMTSFTGLSWNLQSLYFLLAACAPWLGERGHRAIWATFQICLSVSVFVTFVVYVALMPQALLVCGWDCMMYVFYWDLPGFVMHHFNTYFMLVEAYLNRMPFVPAHACFAMIYGNVYVFVSWVNFLAFGNFWYFFFDWRDPYTSIVYIILLLLMICIFNIMARVNSCLKKGVPRELLIGGDSLPTAQGTQQELAAPAKES